MIRDEIRGGVLALLLMACGGDGTNVLDGGVDAGDGRQDAGSPDAGLDAATADAGDDAGFDAAPSDAGVPEPRDLYVFVGRELYALDDETAEATLVGESDLGPITRATFVPSIDALVGVYDNPGTPKLATIDVCTGEGTHLADLTIPGNFIDGIDVDPATGIVFATVSANGTHPADGAAEHFVRLDVSTGVATSEGDLTGIADADHLLLGLPSPIVGNNDSTGNRLVLFGFDPVTRVASEIRTGPRTVRLTPHRGQIYAAGIAGEIAGQLVRVDAATATPTAIGALPATMVGPIVSARPCTP